MSSIVVAVVSLGGRFSMLTIKNDPNILQHAPKHDDEQQPKSNTSIPRMKTDFDSLKNSSTTSFEPRCLELVHTTKSDLRSIYRVKRVLTRVVSIDDNPMRKANCQKDDDAMTVETVKSCSTFDTFENETVEASTHESKIESAKEAQPMETMESSTKEISSTPISKNALCSITTSVVFSDTIQDNCLLKSISTSKFRILCSIGETTPTVKPKPPIIPSTMTRANRIQCDPKSCHYSGDLDPISFLLKVNSRISSSDKARSLNDDMVDIPTIAVEVEDVDVEIHIPISRQKLSGSSGMSRSFVTNAGVFVPAGVVPVQATSTDDDDKTVKTTNTARSINKICEYNQTALRGTSFEDVDDEIDDDYDYTREVESFGNPKMNETSENCNGNTVANAVSSNTDSITILENIVSSSLALPQYSIKSISEISASTSPLLIKLPRSRSIPKEKDKKIRVPKLPIDILKPVNCDPSCLYRIDPLVHQLDCCKSLSIAHEITTSKTYSRNEFVGITSEENEVAITVTCNAGEIIAQGKQTLGAKVDTDMHDYASIVPSSVSTVSQFEKDTEPHSEVDTKCTIPRSSDVSQNGKHIFETETSEPLRHCKISNRGAFTTELTNGHPVNDITSNSVINIVIGCEDLALTGKRETHQKEENGSNALHIASRTTVEAVIIDSPSAQDLDVAIGIGKRELTASPVVAMNILCGSQEDAFSLGNADEKRRICLEEESSFTHSTTNTKAVDSTPTAAVTHGDTVVDDKTSESVSENASGSKGVDNSGNDADVPISPIDEMTRSEQDNVDVAMKPATNILNEDSMKTDLTVYGCTSFTAKHVLNYFMYTSMYMNRRITVTLAGRSSGKLQNLRDEFAQKMTNLRTVENKTSLGLTFDVFVADSSDAPKLKDMAKRTKVVVNCAGPFTKYGTNVVAACAECGTDYVDITGEVTWAGQMRVSHGEAAKKSGARIISFCGFDSIPSDISIFAAIQALREKVPAAKHLSIDEGTTWHCAEGAPNGGTVQTVQIIPLNLQRSFAQPVPFLADDPLVLAHPRQRFDPTNQEIKNEMAKSEWRNQLPRIELFVRFGVSIPFFMAIVNAKIVNASSIALGYGKNFVYRERMFPAGFVNTDKLSFLSLIPALIVQFGTMIAFVVLKLPVIGKMLVDYFFPPGSGPSDLACQSGKTEVYAQVTTEKDKNGQIHRANCRMKFSGDPGNFVTSQCLCEAAWCLLLNKNELPTKSDDGFGTPAELLGPVLLKRLMMTKVRTVAVRTNARQNVSKREMSMFC